MANLLKVTGGVKAQGNPPESWTAPSSMFDSVDRNDGSIYGWAAASSTITLPASDLADGYLIIASYEYHDTSNGRLNPQGKIVQSSGSGNFLGGPTGGYNRDNSEDRSYVRTWAFVDSPSAGATFQFQWKADSDDATGGTEQSVIEVIPLYYSNIGMYDSGDSSLYGGTTPNEVLGWGLVYESDTAAIEMVTASSNVATVKGNNKRYLILGSQFFEGRGGRTQRWHGLTIDGVKYDEAKAYSYYRNTANDESGEMFTYLLETDTSDRTVAQFCYIGDGIGSGQGGADSNGSTPSVGDHTMVIIELNDSAEVFAGSNSTESGDLNVTGPVDIEAVESADIEDTASFSIVSSTAVEAQSAMDTLLGANLSSAQQNVAITSRWTAFGRFTVDGVEDDTTKAGDYARNNQGSIDTFGHSANLLSSVPVTAGQDIGVSIQELSGGEDGGEYHINSSWAGMWGINLDTLEDVGGGPTGQIKPRSGGTFSAKPVKARIGGSFATKPIKHRVGGSFVEPNY